MFWSYEPDTDALTYDADADTWYGTWPDGDAAEIAGENVEAAYLQLYSQYRHTPGVNTTEAGKLARRTAVSVAYWEDKSLTTAQGQVNGLIAWGLALAAGFLVLALLLAVL